MRSSVTRPTVVISEEHAMEVFPNELFSKDFQEYLQLIYNKFVDSLAMINDPTQRFTNDIGWRIIYKCEGFMRDSTYMISKYEMEFNEPFKIFNGLIDIKPFECETNKSNALIKPSHFKFFNRKIKFLDLRNKGSILLYSECDPKILDLAQKRFPQKGLMVIEQNEILEPYIVKPSGDHFGKFVKFVDKLTVKLSEQSEFYAEDAWPNYPKQ